MTDKLKQAAQQAIATLYAWAPTAPAVKRMRREAISALDEAMAEPVAAQEPVDYCTDPNNCKRCKTMPAHRGRMEHAGIGKHPWDEQSHASQQAAPAPVGVEPIGYLYCGGSYGDELEDWEIVADQHQCDKLNEHHGALGKEAKLPIYTTPPPTQPQASGFTTPQPAPASQGDALDAARYRYLRDVPMDEWPDELAIAFRLQQNAIWDAAIDAARKQGGEA